MAKRDEVWTNQDGLFVGFGTRKAEKNTGGNHASRGAIQTQTVKLKGTDMGDTVAASDLENAARIPANALLLSANLFVTTAFTSGGIAVLDIGVYNADTGAVVDDDGIDAAVALAALEDNDTVTCDGALVGTVMAQETKIGASYDTAAFTAGEATLVVRYIVDAG